MSGRIDYKITMYPQCIPWISAPLPPVCTASRSQNESNLKWRVFPCWVACLKMWKVPLLSVWMMSGRLTSIPMLSHLYKKWSSSKWRISRCFFISFSTMVVAIDRRQNSHRMLPRKCDIRLKCSRIATTRWRLSKVAGDLRKYSTTFEDWELPSTFGHRPLILENNRWPSIPEKRPSTSEITGLWFSRVTIDDGSSIFDSRDESRNIEHQFTSHWGQGGTYPEDTLRIHCDFIINSSRHYPGDTCWNLLQSILHFDHNVSSNHMLITFTMYPPK